MNKLYPLLNKINQLGTNVIDSARDSDAQTFLNTKLNQFANYMKDVSDKGLIPVPTVDNNTMSKAMFVKSLMGDSGKSFRILDNPQSRDYLQQTVNTGEISDDGKSLYYGDQLSGAKGQNYATLKDDPGNQIVGRYNGDISEDGTVTTSDVFNTNNPLAWYGKEIVTGSPQEKLYYGAAGLHKALDNMGMTNNHPLGTSIVTGNINAR